MPSTRLLDFVSDTVTRPTPAMRRAMAEAEVGDEQMREDPTVTRLQEMVAALLGKEAALFLPSGTMCNQVAFSVHCRAGDEIILHETAHPVLYEAGGAAALIGAVFRPMTGARGQFSAEDVEAAIRPAVHYMPRSRCVSIEQTANIVGGVCWPQARIQEIAAVARRHQLKMHLDGARLLNAVVATGVSAADFAAPFHSVWLDLTKGLGAPVGAVLAGDRDFIEAAWVHKQRLGGAMRQAGIVAAAGMYALTHHVDRLAEDHANARRLAEGLAQLPVLQLDPSQVETNIVIMEVASPAWDAPRIAERLLQDHRVRFTVIGPRILRAVTHLDLNSADVDVAIRAADAVFGG